MTPFFECSDVTIWNADARTAAGLLEPDSVDAVVTSPPYFGLRDYGVDGQLGLEPTPDEYVSDLADLLTSYAGPLKPGGSLWLNLGDTYSASSSASGAPSETLGGTDQGVRGTPDRSLSKACDFPTKCLLMIPERVALAMIDRGWILRNRVVWAKPNGMPSSAKDRLATKHEALFHFVREPRYFYDLDAIREPHKGGRDEGAKGPSRQWIPNGSSFGNNNRSGGDGVGFHEQGANPGDVWSIPTQPYPEAHFAVYPPELIRRPILATVPDQVCVDCGAPRERLTEEGDLVPTAPGSNISTTGQAGVRAGDTQAAMAGRNFATGGGNSMPRRERAHVGWTDCGCGAGWQPGTVLDLFFGSGTTAVMARRLGRRTVGIELNSDYCALAADRFRQTVLDLGASA